MDLRVSSPCGCCLCDHDRAGGLDEYYEADRVAGVIDISPSSGHPFYLRSLQEMCKPSATTILSVSVPHGLLKACHNVSSWVTISSNSFFQHESRTSKEVLSLSCVACNSYQARLSTKYLLKSRNIDSARRAERALI